MIKKVIQGFPGFLVWFSSKSLHRLKPSIIMGVWSRTWISWNKKIVVKDWHCLIFVGFVWLKLKVWTFWEAHKIWKNLPHGLDVLNRCTSHSSWGRFFEILCASQNVRTLLKVSIFFLPACPKGTYKPSLEPGDKRSCFKCPHKDQISPLGSWVVSQCRCKDGYRFIKGK